MLGNKISMEPGRQHRTQLLFGDEGLKKIQSARVIIFGVGGVGSWCAEGLVRSGLLNLTLVDADCVCVTNCNRQLMATSKTIGQPKVDVLRERLLEISPEANITALQKLYTEESADSFHLEDYDFIVDAIDSLKDKADLILRATALPKHITLISSMGAALRRDPFMVRKAEFWKVTGDPLARALREKFKKQKLFPKRKFQCIYSDEPIMENQKLTQEEQINGPIAKAQVNGSLCHITATFGMAIAGLVINGIVDRK